MKKLLTYITLASVASLLFSCDIDVADNGKLDGFWKLSSIDTLQRGTVDVMDQRLFWSVQADLLYMQDLDHEDAFIFRFDHAGDTLHVHHPYINDKRRGDVPLSSPDSLRLFGLHALSESYVIEYLSHNHMRLRSPDYRLHFRKF